MSFVTFVNALLLCQISKKFEYFSIVFIPFPPFISWIIKQLKSLSLIILHMYL